MGCVGMALGTTYGAKSGMPWWALFVALIITTVFLPIIGTLYCTVGYGPSIENLVQVRENRHVVFGDLNLMLVYVVDGWWPDYARQARREHVLHAIRIPNLHTHA